MTQPTPVDKMNPTELLEEFRNANQMIGKQRPEGIDDGLSRRTDLLEQEILRRMAW